ncbi:molybdenum ABC transporter ATP-binding protein [Zooshikella sp. RANM57]|uniref:molybdenum ABC transporter ATP-binding protein n=1 Tax=Zooshikella sp. RANM57 TaxID=3425863 RepID=UPI003D6EF252
MLQLDIKLDHQQNFTLDLSYTFQSGGITGIFGPSGSGKSTLLNCIAGLEPALNGSVLCNSCYWHNQQQVLTKNHLRGLGYVFQQPRLFPHLDCLANLTFSQRWRSNVSTGSPDIDEVIHELGLSPLLSLYPHQLSGGQKQKIALGRALLSTESVLLMDEPLSAVDQQSKQQITAWLYQLSQRWPIPWLYVSHEINELYRIARELIVMSSGQIQLAGDLLSLSQQAHQFLSSPADAGALLVGTVINHDDHYGLTQLDISPQSLLVERLPFNCGCPVRLQVPARDVSLSLTRPEGSSILNILHGTITELAPLNSHSVLVQVACGEQHILSRITQKSKDQLQLACGMPVFLQVKSIALLNQTV